MQMMQTGVQQPAWPQTQQMGMQQPAWPQTQQMGMQQPAWPQTQQMGIPQVGFQNQMGMQPGGYAPQATAAVDTTGDGRANALVRGVDRNGDGIPDALQGGGMMGGGMMGGGMMGGANGGWRQSYGFDGLELQQLLSTYYSEARGGMFRTPRMSRADFDNSIQRLMRVHSTAVRTLSSTLFTLFDTDRSGSIDWVEFYSGASLYSLLESFHTYRFGANIGSKENVITTLILFLALARTVFTWTILAH